MDLGFYRGFWGPETYFFIRYGDNTYTDGWVDKGEFSAIEKVFTGYKTGQAYHNDGSYTNNTLLIPLRVLTFNDET